MARHEWQDLIWRGGDGKNWPPDARLLAAYLLSGPTTNRIGSVKFDHEEASRQTGLTAARVGEMIDLFESDGFIRIDRPSGWLWMPDVLRVHGFADTEEVRRALPELAAVPRAASFRRDLVRAFRASADRPGPPQPAEPGRLAKLLGDERPSLVRRVTAGLDYATRCRAFMADLVNVRSFRILGLTAAICAVLFVVFPGIDLGVAGWFFEPPRNFTIGASWIGGFFDSDIHYGMEWFLAVIPVLFLYGLIRRRWLWGFTPKRFLFVTLSIALGAGLLTNVVFKDSWGRARPSQIVEFGGTKQFSPPFMRSDQCQKNCSFVSGDASLAASFMAFGVIADSRRRRRWLMVLGSFAALVGVMRMARGSHFLSDVVFAIVFTLMVVVVLARLILQDRWRDWPRWREQPDIGSNG